MTTKEFAKILQDKLTSEYGVELNVASQQQIYRALTNLPKFQKYHFFSHGIYIIIEGTDGWCRAETGRGTAFLDG